MYSRLRERAEWQFFAVLPRADGRLAFAWWTVLLIRGVLPAVFAVAMGALVAAVQKGGGLAAPLAVVGVEFVLLQTLAPIHKAISADLGSRVAAWLYDRLAPGRILANLERGAVELERLVESSRALGETTPWNRRS